MDEKIFSRVDNYISDLLANEDAVLVDAMKLLNTEGLPQHSISANQAKFLQILMLACNAKRVLEIGTLGGYSTIWLARTLPPNGKITTIEANHRYALIAQKNIDHAGLKQKVEIRIGKALDVLPKIVAESNEPFDMVFIDADKPSYVKYFDFALQLSKPGAIIVCDNVIREGKVLDKKSTDEKVKGVQRFNKMLGNNRKVTATILQTVGVKEHDGIAIAVVNQNVV